MKRILSVFLSLFLLTAVLTGCPAREDPTDDPTEGAGTQEQTQASTQEATQKPTTAAPAIPDVTFRLDELPEIGDYVSDEQISYFFPDGPTETLIPRPDYGRLVPYYGAPFRLETDFPGALPGEPAYYEAYLGFAAADGRIVTSPYLPGGDLLETVDLGDGVGWYLFGRYPRDGGDWVCERTVIALDGSWQLHREGYGYTVDLSLFGAPYLLDFDPDTKTCGMYDPATGALVRDLSFLTQNLPQSYEPPKPIWADDAAVLLAMPAAVGGDGPGGGDTVTAYDTQGRELYQMKVARWDVTPVAGSVLRQRLGNGSVRLLEAHGKTPSDRVYHGAFYSAEAELILCPYGEEGEFGVEYFTPRGEQADPAENVWTWDAWSDLMGDDRNVNWTDSLFIPESGSRVCRDFWGGAVEFPIPSPQLSGVLNCGYGADFPVFYVCAANGRRLLCARDGSLLAEIRMPALRGQYDKYGMGSLAVVGDAALVFTKEGELYFYDLTTGTETRVDTAAISSWNPHKEILRLDFSRLAPVGVCCTVSYGTETLDFTFSPTDGRILPHRILLSSETAGYLRVATGGVSCLYAPDGALLYRARNGSLS